jgi:hypothetical protein
MLAHLKIIWQFHAHPVQQKVSRFLGRVIVPYEISKVNFRIETKILVSMSEEI